MKVDKSKLEEAKIWLFLSLSRCAAGVAGGGEYLPPDTLLSYRACFLSYRACEMASVVVNYGYVYSLISNKV